MITAKTIKSAIPYVWGVTFVLLPVVFLLALWSDNTIYIKIFITQIVIIVVLGMLESFIDENY